ncbi:hypothetical protein DBV15_00756 [Temnothorax longispinosus]|uniref:Uncharacterized protein n=1 Tax=Temnothorax longispinosus TaxID=300112 RepID=A0A4S2KNA1_9HYME|nr:hypothetical protein DBV15_00756 [Temnothorax longispinosus]
MCTFFKSKCTPLTEARSNVDILETDNDDLQQRSLCEYQNEDRDLEAQMLAKGLRLTPIKKCGPKYSV